MCYDATAMPPFYGEPLTAVSTSVLSLTSADGFPITAFSAVPLARSGVSVLVLPDNRGLSHFYEQFCTRLAEQGHQALSIDYFSRTAGADHRSRDLSRIEDAMVHLGQLRQETLHGDFATGIAHLQGPVASVGFCLGGRFAFLTAAARFGLVGAVGLYGFPDMIGPSVGPLQVASTLTAPILALWGGGDEGIPASLVSTFDEALTAAGNEHEFVTYPDAPHGFFEASLPAHGPAQADAWRRIAAFLASVR